LITNLTYRPRRTRYERFRRQVSLRHRHILKKKIAKYLSALQRYYYPLDEETIVYPKRYKWYPTLSDPKPFWIENLNVHKTDGKISYSGSSFLKKMKTLLKHF